MLTEGLLLAIVGAAGGVGLAWVMLDVMRTFLIKALSRGADIQLNWKVLAASVAVSMLSSLAAALYPSLRMSRVNPNTALKAGGSAGSERRQHRVRSGFIITQVALTMVLLVVSGLLIRMVTRYRHADLGFDPDHIFATDVNLSPARYQGRDVIRDFYQPLVDRVNRIPGVRAAGLISVLPIQNWGSNSDIHIAGQPPNPPNREMLSEVRMVSAGYYDVFGIPLHRGRALTPTLDRPENQAPAVVVNDAFVKKFLPPGLDPTVQRIEDGDKPEKWTRIVGVVGNVRQDIYEPPLAEHDYLIDEMDLKDRNDELRGMTLVLRFDGDIATIIPALRNALHEVDPTAPYHEGRTMTEVVSETLVFQRMETWLFGIFGGLALVLALVGLYGLVNHEVEQATRDIGVRMALGASRPRILAMVMQRVSWMLGAGILAGLLLTFLVRKLIGVVIYLDLQKDASSSLLIAMLLLVAGAIAALIPACRAASIQPMQALRTE